MVLAEREDYREQLSSVQARLASYDERFARYEDQSASQLRMISDLQAHSEVLKESSEGYMRIRDRFLDTYLRDVEKIPEARWSKAIVAGNKAAHDGDAVADASLFESGTRNDETLMVKIYGLTYGQVLTLSKYSLPPHVLMFLFNMQNEPKTMTASPSLMPALR
jgi:thioesterase domain-containing protein